MSETTTEKPLAEIAKRVTSRGGKLTRWHCLRCNRILYSPGGARQHHTKCHTVQGRKRMKISKRFTPTFDKRKARHDLMRTALIGVWRELKREGALSYSALRREATLLAYREVRFMLSAPGVKLSVSDRRVWEEIKTELCNYLSR